MTVKIYKSNKFDNAPEQYFAEAGGYTLLRMTYSRRRGTIMTATACDDMLNTPPVYRDRKALNAAMRHCVELLGGKAEYVDDAIDGKGRPFVQTDYNGSRDELRDMLEALANKMSDHLKLAKVPSNDTGYSDLRDLYDDLCVVDGEPVYLSDGVYLGPDGKMFG